MAEPTIAAGFAKALIELAVSKGASRQKLVERSHIRAEDLQDQDNRIPLVNYLALMKAGMELGDEPALALQFGEAFSMPELSIVGLVGQAAETVEEAVTQMNRYVRLMLDADVGGTAEWFELTRSDGGGLAGTSKPSIRSSPAADRISLCPDGQRLCPSVQWQVLCQGGSLYPRRTHLSR